MKVVLASSPAPPDESAGLRLFAPVLMSDKLSSLASYIPLVKVTANPQPASCEKDDDFSSGKYENP